MRTRGKPCATGHSLGQAACCCLSSVESTDFLESRVNTVSRWSISSATATSIKTCLFQIKYCPQRSFFYFFFPLKTFIFCAFCLKAHGTAAMHQQRGVITEREIRPPKASKHSQSTAGLPKLHQGFLDNFSETAAFSPGDYLSSITGSIQGRFGAFRPLAWYPHTVGTLAIGP